MNRPELAKRSYRDQYQALMYDAFGWADFWKNSLEPLGYEVTEVVANAESMQRAWAQEKGLKEPGKDWLLELAAQQVLEAKPDILFVTDYVNFTRRWLAELRLRCPSIRAVLGWCGAPYQDPDVFKAYDVVLSNLPELVLKFNELGHSARHLRHAFDSRILERLPEDTSEMLDFTFVGQVVRSQGFHRKREKLIVDLIETTPLAIFSPSHGAGIRDIATSIARWSIRTVWNAGVGSGITEKSLSRIPILHRGARYFDRPPLPVHPRLWNRLSPPVFGLEMFRVLQKSRMTLNSHIELSREAASNMRLFEATGSGACLLTDWKSNLGDLFDLETEVVCYRSAEECTEKVNYLLEHEEERKAIALAGQRKTLADHTFQNRALELNDIIRQALSPKGL